MSFDRRRCGREPRWRERKWKRKRKTGGSRKRKGFPLQELSEGELNKEEELSKEDELNEPEEKLNKEQTEAKEDNRNAEEDIHGVQPSAVHDGNVVPLWESYLNWLKLMVGHLEAIWIVCKGYCSQAGCGAESGTSRGSEDD